MKLKPNEINSAVAAGCKSVADVKLYLARRRRDRALGLWAGILVSLLAWAVFVDVILSWHLF